MLERTEVSTALPTNQSNYVIDPVRDRAHFKCGSECAEQVVTLVFVPCRCSCGQLRSFS